MRTSFAFLVFAAFVNSAAAQGKQRRYAICRRIDRLCRSLCTTSSVPLTDELSRCTDIDLYCSSRPLFVVRFSFCFFSFSCTQHNSATARNHAYIRTAQIDELRACRLHIYLLPAWVTGLELLQAQETICEGIVVPVFSKSRSTAISSYITDPRLPSVAHFQKSALVQSRATSFSPNLSKKVMWSFHTPD